MKKSTVMKKMSIAKLTEAISETGYPLKSTITDKSTLADIYISLITKLENGNMTKEQIAAKYFKQQLADILTENKITFPEESDHYKLAAIYFVNQEEITKRKHSDPPTDEHVDAEKAVAAAEKASPAKPKKNKAKDETKKASSVKITKDMVMNATKSKISDEVREACGTLKFDVSDLKEWKSWPTLKLVAKANGVNSYGQSKDFVVKELTKKLKKK